MFNSKDPMFSTSISFLMLGVFALFSCDTAVAEPAVKEKPAAEKQKVEQQEKKEQLKFIRVNRDEKNRPLSLDTAICTYVPADGKNEGLVVELVGAVHIGEKEYYQDLNKLFKTYDVLLYELVAEAGTRIPKGGRKEGGASALSSFQVGLQKMLELEFQLNAIDYTPKNFVHADMSPEEFAKSMKARGESWMKMYFRMMGASMAMQAKQQGTSDADLLLALFSENRAYALRQVMAEQFDQPGGGGLAVLDGKNGSTIITERNKKAFEVLKKEIAAGHKKIGIFYGAGHLRDMDERMIKEFGMKRTDLRWKVAWKLNK